jgi:hypothetical protein
VKDKLVTIYKLLCPISLDIRYIGKTVNIVRRRLDHCRYKDPNKYFLSKIDIWGNELVTNGLKPIFEIITTCTESEWRNLEMFWIKKYRDEGLNLLNTTNGGDAINVPITDKHISRRLKGGKMSDYYSPEEVMRMSKIKSENSKGSKNPNFGGKLQTEEYMMKQSVSNSKKPIKVIDTLDENKEYIFINSKEAGKFFGVKGSRIRMAKAGKYKVKKRYIILDL